MSETVTVPNDPDALAWYLWRGIQLWIDRDPEAEPMDHEFMALRSFAKDILEGEVWQR